MVPAVRLHEFDTRGAAAQAAANRLAESLELALAEASAVGLLVSGGSSPRECLEILSRKVLDWQRVVVLPTDERCVAPDDPASNERMVRAQLLQNHARMATYERPRPGEHAPGEIAAALVGMGEDGHFASIFPDAPPELRLLDVEARAGYHRIATASSEYQRITANLSLLLRARSVCLLVFGDAKKRVLSCPGDLPVHSLIAQSSVPVEVIWAP